MPNDVEPKKKATPKTGTKARDKDKPLRARPANGEIDWAELSREHIRRYPKIRARLAE